MKIGYLDLSRFEEEAVNRKPMLLLQTQMKLYIPSSYEMYVSKRY